MHACLTNSFIKVFLPTADKTKRYSVTLTLKMLSFRETILKSPLGKIIVFHTYCSIIDRSIIRRSIKSRVYVLTHLLNVASFFCLSMFCRTPILYTPEMFYICADRYVICADLFLRMRGKFTIICAFQLRGFYLLLQVTWTFNRYPAHNSTRNELERVYF